VGIGIKAGNKKHVEASSVGDNVFYVFFQISKICLFTFFEMTCQKVVISR